MAAANHSTFLAVFEIFDYDYETPAPSSIWQSSWLLTRRFWVRVPGGGWRMKSENFRQLCRDLRIRGYTLGQIAQITKRPKTSVFFHIRDVALPHSVRVELSRRMTERLVAYNKQRKGKSALDRHPRPFTAWTPDLVTLISHFLFDGEIRPGGCIYTNRSEALLQRVECFMRFIYDFPPRRVESTPGVWRISYHNVELATYVRQKSKELLHWISAAPAEYRRAFLKSFFDDEGSVYWRKNKRAVRGYQHNLEILHLIHYLLRKFDIESKIDERYCEIVISRKRNLKRFASEINITRGVRVNGNRSNSIWKQSLEKREILRRALASYQK